MEALDEETMAELKAKAIERGGDESDIITNEIDEELKDPEETVQDVVVEEPPQEVKKPKRQRSEKQKAAFEKARLKRAENLKIKKQIEAEKKEAKKKEKEQVKKEVQERLAENHSVKTASMPQPIEQRYEEPQPRYREQVVNNYYYYGADFQPPTYTQSNPAIQYYEPEPEKPKRGRKKKVVVKEPEPETESESESEEEIVYSDPEEPQSYKELQNYQEEDERQLPPKQNNGLKFRFA
tara:strand:- start:586 stop:1299 length:714 start_codon:yes stop_codon:yes gene_type:complete